MKTKNIIKTSLRLCAFFLILVGLRSSAFAALDCSSSFCLDFGGVVFGSENLQSDSVELQSGTAPIETNSESNSFKIATINLLPICGDNIVDVWEQCDGTDLNGLTCTDYGFDLGVLACTTSCFADTSGCYYHSVPLPPKPDPKPDVPPVTPPVTPPEEEPEEPEEPEVPEVEIPEEIEEIVIAVDELWTIPPISIPRPKPLIVEIEEKDIVTPWAIVIDETLFIANNLEYVNPENPAQDYTIRVVTPDGIILHSQDITTDKNGNFVFEYETPIEDGKYLIYVYDENNYFVKSYPVNLVEREIEDFRVIKFADQESVVNDFLETVELGKIKPYEEQTTIEGIGTENSKVTAYFIDENGEIIIVKTFVDCYQEWKMEIPEGLGLGEHKVYIVEEYPDGILTKDLTYTFEITEKCDYCCLVVFLLIFIFFIIHHYFELPDKKERKKFRNKIKKYFSRMFVLVLVLAILPIKPGLTSVPQFLIYEGRLLDSSGYILNTAHTFRFSFWTVSDKTATDVDSLTGVLNVGAANYAGWTEVQTITPNNNGTFSIELGSLVSLPTIDYNVHKFLQVEVKTGGQPDSAYELMDPTGDNGADTDDRKTLGSVPYAYVAESAQWSNDETFTLDHDNTVENAGTGSIELQFGDTLARILSYDTDNAYFDFNDNVNIQGNLTITGTVDGVDISELSFDDLKLREKEMTFEPEYDSSSVYADGTDNRGKLETFAIDLGGIDKINLYQWTTKQNAQQDFDLVISYQLPKDFDSFMAAPMTIKYRTSDGVLATNKVDLTFFDTTGTAVTLTGADNLANASWTTANITFGGSPTFTAGDTITIHIKLSTDRTGFSQVSDIVLNYNGR